MKSHIHHTTTVIPLFLYLFTSTACGTGEPPPSFGEKPRSRINLTIDQTNDNLESGDSVSEVASETPLDPDLFDEIINNSFPDVSDQYSNQSGDNSPDQSGLSSSDDLTDEKSTLDQGSSRGNDIVNTQEFVACQHAQGVSSDRIVVASESRSINLSQQSVGAFKVVGNQAILELNLQADSQSQLQGICLFLAGNQPEAIITVRNVKLQRLVVFAKGNQAKTEVQFLTGSGIEDLAADLAGNRANLVVTGAGSVSCENGLVRLRGASSAWSCN